MKNTQKPYDVAVFIGRFQPVHLGHEAILKRCSELADNVIVLVGSKTASRSVRNPFTYQERLQMLDQAIGGMHLEKESVWYCRGIADSAYNFHDWLTRAKSTVKKTVEEDLVDWFGERTTVNTPPKVCIVGHYKDDTSYYLNYFPEWELVQVGSLLDGISSTLVRTGLFGYTYAPKSDGTYYTDHLSPNVNRWIRTWAEGSGKETFDKMVAEFTFIWNYRKKWDAAPFKPTFVTTDAVVVALGHVLVIKRGRNPGKGLYALPGGFLEQDERIVDGCIRELKEETKFDLPKVKLEAAIKDQYVFDHPLRDPRGRTITHAFLFDLKNTKNLEDYHVEASDDAEKNSAVWMPINEVQAKEDQFFNDHAQIVRFFLNRMR